MKSQIWVKNGGSKISILVRTYFGGGPVLSKKWGEALSSGLGFENLQGDEIPNLGQKRWVKIFDFGENLF